MSSKSKPLNAGSIRPLRLVGLVFIAAAVLITPDVAVDAPAGNTEVLFFDAANSHTSYTNFLEELRKQGVTARHKIDVRFASFDTGSKESVRSTVASAVSGRKQIFVATSVTVAQVMLATIKEKPIVFHSRVEAWDANILSQGDRDSFVTGTSNQIPVERKHLEFWRDIRLGVKRLGVISHPNEITDGFLRRLKQAERLLDLDVELFIVSDPKEFQAALASRVHRKIDAWYIPLTFVSYRYPLNRPSAVGE